MYSIPAQLAAASAHARAIAAARAAKAKEDAARLAKSAAARKKQWAARQGQPNNLKLALVARLPKTEAEAIPLAGVEALFADHLICPSGISSALSILIKERKIARTGERLAYRYYANP